MQSPGEMCAPALRSSHVSTLHVLSLTLVAFVATVTTVLTRLTSTTKKMMHREGADPDEPRLELPEYVSAHEHSAPCDSRATRPMSSHMCVAALAEADIPEAVQRGSSHMGNKHCDTWT